MSRTREKEKALVLRKAGTSIKQIAKLLHVSPSTVSVWCRDVVLTKEAMHKITSSGQNRTAAGLLAYSQAKQKQRQRATVLNSNIGQNMVGNLSQRDLLLLGIGLYWGEGYKNGNREFGFTNSDPDMVKFYVLWLHQIFGIEKDRLTLRVSINSQHKKRIDDVESYWSNLLDIPRTQFTKPSLIKTQSKKKFTNFQTHYGTLRIKVQRGSDYREQILGAIDSIKTYSTPNSLKTFM